MPEIILHEILFLFADSAIMPDETGAEKCSSSSSNSPPRETTCLAPNARQAYFADEKVHVPETETVSVFFLL